MLISRLFGWVRNHSTTHIFLLEILAVFIGIDGSGTRFGWQSYIGMQQDEADPAVWRVDFRSQHGR